MLNPPASAKVNDQGIGPTLPPHRWMPWCSSSFPCLPPDRASTKMCFRGMWHSGECAECVINTCPAWGNVWVTQARRLHIPCSRMWDDVLKVHFRFGAQNHIGPEMSSFQCSSRDSILSFLERAIMARWKGHRIWAKQRNKLPNIETWWDLHSHWNTVGWCWMRWFSGLQTFSLSSQIRCLPRTDILQEKSSTLKSQCMAGKVLVTWAYFAGTKTNVARARHAFKSFNLVNFQWLPSHGQIRPSACRQFSIDDWCEWHMVTSCHIHVTSTSSTIPWTQRQQSSHLNHIFQPELLYLDTEVWNSQEWLNGNSGCSPHILSLGLKHVKTMKLRPLQEMCVQEWIRPVQ